MLHCAPVRWRRMAVVGISALLAVVGVPGAHADGPSVSTIALQ